MIYTTTKKETISYTWNTGIGLDLEEGILLSDYTGLEEEFNTNTIEATLKRVYDLNKASVMIAPSLMTVISGDSKSCRVWIDKSDLELRSEIEDPKKDFEYYSDQ